MRMIIRSSILAMALATACGDGTPVGPGQPDPLPAPPPEFSIGEITADPAAPGRFRVELRVYRHFPGSPRSVPAPRVSVTFAVLQGTGTISPAHTVTGADGIALAILSFPSGESHEVEYRAPSHGTSGKTTILVL